jgi:hypothetical protein
MAKRRGGRAKAEQAVGLVPAQLAAALRLAPAGEVITEDLILQDVRAGAPVDAKGRVDLVRYTAWLLKRHGYGAK